MTLHQRISIILDQNQGLCRVRIGDAGCFGDEMKDWTSMSGPFSPRPARGSSADRVGAGSGGWDDCIAREQRFRQSQREREGMGGWDPS